MLVRYWMSPTLISVPPEATLAEAMQRMRYHDISMVPVVSERRLLGVICRDDLQRAIHSGVGEHSAPDGLESTVQSCMNREPVVADENLTVEEAAELLLVNKISAMPVVKADRTPVGVITASDLFKVLISLTGIERKGAQFAFTVADRPGCIRELTDTIRSYGGRILSILSSSNHVPRGKRKLYIRVSALDRPRLDRLKSIFLDEGVLRYLVFYEGIHRQLFSADLLPE
ncbi:MAG: CBS and ACT domain-containing protein [Desulfobacteraceae bacterium]|nr:CBS and ACT domain-containing protein [Desulfobacteraceae bacterium]